jgi:nitrate/TMAO reductase-like tetraheme cytochrome c subunit
MKTLTKISLVTAFASGCIVLSTLLGGCKVNENIASKNGIQLWSENCNRCHNTPPATAFSAEQWVTIGLHMQSRALITDMERDKIVNYLKGD